VSYFTSLRLISKPSLLQSATLQLPLQLEYIYTMRLFSIQFISSLLAIKQVGSIYAYPTTFKDTTTIAANVQNHPAASLQYHPELIERAPSKVVQVTKEANFATWRGHYAFPRAMSLYATLSRNDVIQYAKDTYKSIESKTTGGTLLVSVMYVPGQGVAAGTIWVGERWGFEALAQRRAPAFWSSLSGVQQNLRPWAYSTHLWHAEAVAAVTAEEELGEGMVDGLWPEGTMIYTYGRVNNQEVDKASCRGTNSPVTVPCKEWLDRLRIGIIEP
jgi:hypothetical protein